MSAADQRAHGPAWMLDAACAALGAGGEDFFPETGGSTANAKRVCNGGPGRDVCPVRNDCLLYALANGERFGVWGGLSERERRALVTASREAAA
ncbi:WhiB family transcriptional regulator [Occultella kanbiaonis]|uniref:WhiB family transcriptional regulator n=1 Tax=Occultella kanbiaonis TaxID=2675754 RepID=UPI0013D7E8A9|nr:WhiB family transcriptional regulator [Occultella kanbiaonis]